MFKTSYYTKLFLKGEVLISCNANSNLRSVLETITETHCNGARDAWTYNGRVSAFRNNVLRMFRDRDFVIGLISWKEFKKLPDYESIPISTGRFDGIPKFSLKKDNKVYYIAIFTLERAQLFDISIVNIKSHNRTDNRFDTDGNRRTRHYVTNSDSTDSVVSRVSVDSSANTNVTINCGDSEYTYTLSNNPYYNMYATADHYDYVTSHVSLNQTTTPLWANNDAYLVSDRSIPF